MLIVTVTLNTSVDRTVAVPGFAIGTHLKGTLVSCQPAGKGVNVSRGLAGLGVPSVVAGFVGQREATWFHDSFADLPATVALTPVDSSTRTCTTLLDPTSGTDTHVREAGPTVGPHHVA
ncbi:MAG: 1-phosphofructokinase, partial [Candidatus Brocadiae bacterium]|nr:1-phosphofructokinase [Candidatus Brocadiia bacterium]